MELLGAWDEVANLRLLVGRLSSESRPAAIPVRWPTVHHRHRWFRHASHTSASSTPSGAVAMQGDDEAPFERIESAYSACGQIGLTPGSGVSLGLRPHVKPGDNSTRPALRGREPLHPQTADSDPARSRTRNIHHQESHRVISCESAASPNRRLTAPLACGAETCPRSFMALFRDRSVERRRRGSASANRAPPVPE